GLFAALGILSLLWTFDVTITLQRALLNAVTVFGLYVYSRKTTSSEQLSVIALSCFFTSLVVFLGALPAYYLDASEAYVQGNFKGYFGNSNSLGHYISSAALPLCLFLFFSESRWKRMVALLGSAALFFLLIEARSRGAFVSILASGAVLYFG